MQSFSYVTIKDIREALNNPGIRAEAESELKYYHPITDVNDENLIKYLQPLTKVKHWYDCKCILHI
jgi:hypothetical protein